MTEGLPGSQASRWEGSIAGQGGVDDLRPSIYAASDVGCPLKAMSTQEAYYHQAAAAMVAQDQDIAVLRQPFERGRHLTHGDVGAAREGADRQFVRLTHVEQHGSRLQFAGGGGDVNFQGSRHRGLEPWRTSAGNQPEFTVDAGPAAHVVGRMTERFVVIMAGGRGERFWPQSRLHKPKHLLPIVGKDPMLSQTIARVLPLVPAKNILVITTQQQLAEVRKVCAGLPRKNIIVEPVGRDTAPAVGLAMLLVKKRNPEAAFAVLPADHVIGDEDGFRALLDAAFRAAESADELVTLGIEPTEPATGFGYIERGKLWHSGPPVVLRAKRFVEKPNLAKAKAYLASRRFYWNAGMFVWRVPVVTAALQQHAPELFAGLLRLGKALSRAGADKALARLYPTLPRISVDYAVMEKSRNVLVLPASFGWDDVGSWPAVERHHGKDAGGNVLRGRAIVEAGRNNIVVSADGHITAVLGLDDLIVVHTSDATLVCPKCRAQDIKLLLQRLASDPALKKHL